MDGTEDLALSVTLPNELVVRIAEQAADIATKRLAETADAEEREGYLTASGAARYLGVSRQRIYQLTSARTLHPDGRDGRTPLYTRRSLDRYVRDGLGEVR